LTAADPSLFIAKMFPLNVLGSGSTSWVKTIRLPSAEMLGDVSFPARLELGLTSPDPSGLAKKNSSEFGTCLSRRILPFAASGKAAWLAAGATSTDARTRRDTANLLILPYVLLAGNLDELYPAGAATTPLKSVWPGAVACSSMNDTGGMMFPYLLSTWRLAQ
jgi:hypothetical protein